MATASDPLVEEARASYEAGDFDGARQKAVAGLAERPDDPALLRLAGLAGLELDDDDAIDYLQRAADAAPDDADAWRELGGALTMSGRLQEAGAAFRRASELRPGDTRVLVDLGHIALSTGETDAALPYFEQARVREPGNTEALPALVEVYRRAGRLEDGLAAARDLSDAQPDHVVAALDVLDLALDLDRLDDAEAACSRASAADDDPEHDVYHQHALIEIAARREQWRRALDLAVDATRVDRLGRTTDILAYVVAQVFGTSDRPSPSPRPSRRRSRTPARSTGSSIWRTLASEAVAAPKTGGDVQWTKCPSCDAFVYHKRLRRNMGVCPECNYHFRLPVATRLELLLDEGSFEELSGDIEPLDPIGFTDSKPYSQRIEEAQRKTGQREGVVYGTAPIDGHPLVVAAMDFAFIGGSMGSGVGEAITRAAELALERRCRCWSSARRAARGCRRAASR